MNTVVLDGDCSLELIQDGSADIFLPLKPPTYAGPYAVTPTKQTQTLQTDGKGMDGDVTVEPIPEEYIDPSGSVTLTSNGSHSVREYASAEVAVPLPEIYTGANIITPTKQTQTLQTAGKELADNITVNPIPGAYIIPEGSLSIDENGTFDVAQFAQAVVNVAGGGGGLEYETGIWTPAEDTTRGTINFSNSHGLGPTIYVLRQADGAWPTQTQTATGVTFINVFKLTEHNFHYSSGVTKEAVSRVNYVGSNLSGNLSGSTTWIDYDTNEPSDNSSYAGFYASKYGLYPYGGSRYWRSAIAYKWLAIWL